MRHWRTFLEPLTRSRLGFCADGRALGLGLASAMARQDPAAEVERYLREQPAAEPARTAS